MTSLRFEWEARKTSTNLKKYGVSFEEAKSVFYDESAMLISGPDHSENEDRFILLGVSLSLQIIYARKEMAKESKAY